jgi:hypothetical protein
MDCFPPPRFHGSQLIYGTSQSSNLASSECEGKAAVDAGDLLDDLSIFVDLIRQDLPPGYMSD